MTSSAGPLAMSTLMPAHLLAALTLLAPAISQGHAGTPGEFARCRALAADTERLACYDAVTGGAVASPTSPAPVLAGAPGAGTPGATASPPPPARSAPTPEQLFGLDATQSDARVREASGIGRVEELQLRVTDVQRDATGKAMLAFDNGQAWAQLDNTPARLAPGDAVVIRRAAFGSYLLVPATGSRSIRVRRLR